jgi:hypothetical protein
LRTGHPPEKASSSPRITDRKEVDAMALTTDQRLLDVCCDVVIRFKGHRSYGGEQGALKALKKRTGFLAEECREAFDALCKVYDRAVDVLPGHTASPPGARFAALTDVDFDACMREINAIAPGEAMLQKGQILNWVIFWHYLK